MTDHSDAAHPGVSSSSAGPLVLTITSETMGRGDDVLGQILIRNFLHTLCDTTPKPQTIIFYNSGVKLVVEGSPVLDDLQALAEDEVALLSCGTCLAYFGVKDKVAAGEVTNMYAISEVLMRAGKVVSIC